MPESFVRQFCKYLVYSNLCWNWQLMLIYMGYCPEQPALTAAIELYVNQNRFMSYILRQFKIEGSCNGSPAVFKIQMLAQRCF